MILDRRIYFQLKFTDTHYVIYPQVNIAESLLESR